ncbi:MAG: hypothetical protein Q8865_08585, partial [Bacillota bacterium]|nr:hypothetical protein [Bacillota bacterium]
DHMLKNPTVPIGDVDYVLRLHTGLSRYRDDDAVSMPGNIADPGMLAYLNKWNDDPKVDHSAVFPKMIINADDNEKKSEIMKDVNTYANEMILKFIVGAEPLSNYDKYVQTIKGMNIDQATSIMQKAYESYTNRKK